jgi:hypothetical protein
MSELEAVQTQPYGIKLESTSKGVRLSVHVYGPEGLSEDARKRAIEEAVLAFDVTNARLHELGYATEATAQYKEAGK